MALDEKNNTTTLAMTNKNASSSARTPISTPSSTSTLSSSTDDTNQNEFKTTNVTILETSPTAETTPMASSKHRHTPARIKHSTTTSRVSGTPKSKPTARRTTTMTTMTTMTTTAMTTAGTIVSKTSTLYRNTSDIIVVHPTIGVRDKTTDRPENSSSDTVGGVDQNLVIGAAIIAGLIVIVAVAAVILYVSRRRQSKNKISRRKPPSTITFTGSTNGIGTIDSPSSVTINISERLELIKENPSQSGNRVGGVGGGGDDGAASFQNNGVVTYHKEEEYIAIWALDEIKEQQKQEVQKKQQYHHNHRDSEQQQQQQQQQQQLEKQQCDETDFSTHVQHDNLIVVNSISKPPPSGIPRDLHLEHNVYANFTPGRSSTLRGDVTDNLHNHHPSRNPSPTPDYDADNDNVYEKGPDDLSRSTPTEHTLELAPLHQAPPSDFHDDENVYENHRLSRASQKISIPNTSGSDVPQRESWENACRVNDGYVDEENSKHDQELGTTNPNKDNYITNTNDVPPAVTQQAFDKNKTRTQTSIPSENYYEEEEPEPDYNKEKPPILSRDSGIDAGYDGDANYDVPVDLENRPQSQNLIDGPSSANRNNDNDYVLPSPIMGLKNSSGDSSTAPESNYYMSPYSDDEIERRVTDTPDDLNYENTKPQQRRPETYMAPDDLELKSPTDEDELLKIYDNFEFKVRNGNSNAATSNNIDTNTNMSFYETPGELDRIYETPYSARSSIKIPAPQDEEQTPKRLQKLLSYSMPTRIERVENERERERRALLMTSSSQDSATGSMCEELGCSPESVTSRTTQRANAASPESTYINSPDSFYVNSPSSETLGSEMDEAEYHTPKDVSQSPFFQNLDKNRAKTGIKTLPLAFKPPPPRLFKSTSLEIHDNHIHQRNNPNNTRVTSENHHHFSESLPKLANSNDIPIKPTKKPANVKSLTLDTSGKSSRVAASPKNSKKKAALPVDKSSPLLMRGASQSLNDIHEGEEETSTIYHSPRPSAKSPKFLGRPQSPTSPDRTTDSNISYPGQRKKSVPGLDGTGGPGNVDMGELHAVMQRRGLLNK